MLCTSLPFAVLLPDDLAPTSSSDLGSQKYHVHVECEDDLGRVSASKQRELTVVSTNRADQDESLLDIISYSVSGLRVDISVSE